jgi:hypothetical protein
MDKQSIINSIKSEIKQSKKLRDKAYLFYKLEDLIDTLRGIQKEIEIDLIRDQVNESFIEERAKVYYHPGNQKTEIDTKKLFDFFKKRDRVNDFVKSVKVSETQLKKIKDGEELIFKFKIPSGLGNESVKVGKISDKELKELVE